MRRLKAKNIEGATKANVKSIDEIIKLYGERKISNIATAKNLIKGLTSNKKVYDNAFHKYKDSIKELKEKQPLNQRMAEAKKRKKKNTYLVSFYRYKRGSPEERKQKPAFRANGFSYYYLVNFDLHSATIKASEFPNREAINKRILEHLSREDDASETINPEYTTIINLLKEDEEFESWL